MEKRKNPEKELTNKSGLFFQIGLLMAMMLCVSAFEYKTKVIDPPVCGIPIESIDDILPPIITKLNIPKPPKPKVKLRPDPTKVKEGDPETMKIEPTLDEPDDVIPDPYVEEPFPDELVEPDELFILVESMPQPIGGYKEFYKFIGENLKYPAKARRTQLEGKVFVQFVVNADGSLSDFEILKSIGGGCDEEVLRIMKMAEKWTPGKQRGAPVRVRQVLPVSFQFNN